MKLRFRFVVCLAAALVSACAARPADPATSLSPTVVQAAEAAGSRTPAPADPPTATIPATATAATAAPTATPTPTTTPTLAPSPTPTIPVPPAAAAYLSGARVQTYDPLDRQGDFRLSGGETRFENGHLVTKSKRWDTYNWVNISFDRPFGAGTAILIQFKFSGGGNYFTAGFTGNGIARGLSYTGESGFYLVNTDGKDLFPEAAFSGNYLARAGEWNSLLLGAGKDGRFHVMMIDPQRPQRNYCWDTYQPEWAGSGWAFQGFTNASGTLELKDFLIVQFDGFEKCSK